MWKYWILNPKEWMNDNFFFLSFQLFREVRIMKILNHPNIGKWILHTLSVSAQTAWVLILEQLMMYKRLHVWFDYLSSLIISILDWCGRVLVSVQEHLTCRSLTFDLSVTGLKFKAFQFLFILFWFTRTWQEIIEPNNPCKGTSFYKYGNSLNSEERRYDACKNIQLKFSNMDVKLK